MCGKRRICCNGTDGWFDVDIQVAGLFFRPRLLSELLQRQAQAYGDLWWGLAAREKAPCNTVSPAAS